jgi:predicted ester cyclase
MGIAPTGRRIEFRGIEAMRVESDLIVERAGEWDGLAILEQIGAFNPKG